MTKTYAYIALGDSYTVGEGVALHQSFPYQVVRFLRKTGFQFSAPEIIARTGWTTDELAAAMEQHRFLPQYDFATLLIGVNNQYRGRAVEEYKLEFETLLNKVLQFADKKEHVLVLSIPDYGSSPFAKNLDGEKIAREIDLFNSVNKALSVQYKVQYVDVTRDGREAHPTRETFAQDGLHPSEKEYGRWAEKVFAVVRNLLK